MWNHFNTDGARTINHLEGWHAALDKTVAQKNCNRPQKMKPKYKKLEERLSFAKERLQNGAISILEYMDAIMFHLHL
ncbi:unnamed protein product [Macrosiphum euphorbiae]|uniref:Transposase n=1 Tax=Macrosiphum euphorbiae TaxID=13131 RepID=A0AAV0XPW5_9HEMI|nr:unnamed protein product [Macrosiphum euphorbiae]